MTDSDQVPPPYLDIYTSLSFLTRKATTDSCQARRHPVEDET